MYRSDFNSLPLFSVLGLGIIDPIGHADFYPNGGHWQFGCIWNEDKDSISKMTHSFNPLKN